MMADDMGLGDTSAYQDFTGNRDRVQVHTPQMDRLARMGVLPAGQTLRLDSSPHLGVESPGRWRLGALTVRVLGR